VSAVIALAPLARSHQLFITHGNGPQVGVLALESARLDDDEALLEARPARSWRPPIRDPMMEVVNKVLFASR
jgi:carbamate kinase